ncbi:hypothetical protein JYT22_00615 [Endomicrobium sp. AH-315-J14]|nr:hypothetical protein [Endomicrobium sp. AH-315-J14]
MSEKRFMVVTANFDAAHADPNADAIRSVFALPEYQEVVAARNRAHPTLNVFICDSFAPPV